jgi:hypothetical protein
MTKVDAGAEDGEGQLPFSQPLKSVSAQQQLSALLGEGLNALALRQLFQRLFVGGDDLNAPPQQHFGDGTTRNTQTQDGDKGRQLHRRHPLPKKFDSPLGRVEPVCQN